MSLWSSRPKRVKKLLLSNPLREPHQARVCAVDRLAAGWSDSQASVIPLFLPGGGKGGAMQTDDGGVGVVDTMEHTLSLFNARTTDLSRPFL